MRTKMTWAGAVLLAACIHPYPPAGGPGPLNVSGFYEVSEELYFSDCGPVAARKDRMRVEVQHSPGTGFARIIVDSRPFDAQLATDGSFNIRPWQSSSGQETSTSSISGRFTATGFYARVNVTMAIQRLARDARPPGCSYQLRWSGEKL